MAHVVGVRFKDVGKVYYFEPNEESFALGDMVIVETVRGVEDVFETVKSWLGLSSSEQHTNIHPNAERWITLSACESNQVNIEMKSPTAGKLTYAIYSKVKNREFGTNEEFFERLRIFVKMNTGSRPQRPTMTGETAKYRIADILR